MHGVRHGKKWRLHEVRGLRLNVVLVFISIARYKYKS